MTRHATITGVGSSLPPRLVPNTWFESQIETSDEWIRDRTGIEARHFADDGVVTSDLAVDAARIALDSAGVAPEQVDLIVCATITGDTPFPATAVWVQQKLGLSCPAFDVNAACAGFSYGLASASAFVEAGMADTVLLIGAEVFSRFLDFSDRQTCVLFGDGAGATVHPGGRSSGDRGHRARRGRHRRRRSSSCPAAGRASRRRSRPSRQSGTASRCPTAARCSSAR